jgi:hypothetical protein
MKIKYYLALLVSFFFLNNSFAQNATFTDHDFIPTTNVSIISEFQTAVYHNGYVFVATTKGVWKNNISTQVWELSGLQDKKISCIYKHQGVANKLFAGALIDNNNSDPLFISSDGGNTWVAASNPVSETYSNIVARPNNPDHLYAAPNNYNFMVSTDGGNNWVYANGGSGGMLGYSVNLAFIPSNANLLFYGSENPLDDARLDRYNIDETNPTQLIHHTVIVSNNIWGNRRPDKLHTYTYTGNYIYVGQEGALSKVNTNNINDVTYIYKSEREANKPYSYMYGHWTDPNNINHLIFGGNINGNNTGLMQLYETNDEGVTFYRYTQTFGVDAPMIRDIVEITPTKLAVIINDQYNNRVKLVVMEPESLSYNNNELWQKNIHIYPNPANDFITVSSQNNDEMLVSIYNSLGIRIMKEIKINSDEVISLQKIPKGIYFAKIIIGDKTVVKKIVLKNNK